MDRLLLREMSFYGYHGDVEAERELGGRYRVDLEIGMDLTPVARTDNIEGAVDYVHGDKKADGLLMAPVYAVPRLLARNKLTLDDFDFIEIHEAFAGTVLATLKAWEDPELWDGAQRRVVGLASSQIATEVLAGEGLAARNITQWLGIQRRLADGGQSTEDQRWRLRAGDLVAAATADDDQSGPVRINRSSVERWLVAGGDAGRPLSPRNAWALIGLASGDGP